MLSPGVWGRVRARLVFVPQVLYKESAGQATPTPVTPEMERVRRNQEQISSVLPQENPAPTSPAALNTRGGHGVT